jgi:hypothetical protein
MGYSTKDIKIKKTAKGTVLQAKIAGKWHSVQLDTKRKSGVQKPDRRIERAKKQTLDRGTVQVELGIEGAAIIDNAIALSAIRRVSGCISDTSKIFFELPMGKPGQIKIILHQERNNSTNMKVVMKTIVSNVQVFESSQAGNVLWLVCDGTYWYPLSEEINYTSGSGAPTAWTTTA